MPHPSHPPRLYNCNFTWRRLQIMQLPRWRTTPCHLSAATLHWWRPSLHPQPEDTLFCGDKGTVRTCLVQGHSNNTYLVDIRSLPPNLRFSEAVTVTIRFNRVWNRWQRLSVCGAGGPKLQASPLCSVTQDTDYPRVRVTHSATWNAVSSH
jgi:hypothetical protein